MYTEGASRISNIVVPDSLTYIKTTLIELRAPRYVVHSSSPYSDHMFWPSCCPPAPCRQITEPLEIQEPCNVTAHGPGLRAPGLSLVSLSWPDVGQHPYYPNHLSLVGSLCCFS